MGTLTFIGLGIYDEKDATLKALETARRCDELFMETYTSRLAGTTAGAIERLVGKKITLLSREDVERGDELLEHAKKKNVALLVGGDPMVATTHVDLRLRAAEKGIATPIIHGVSISTAAVGLLGLQSYKFGRTTTLVLPEKNYFPESPYDVIKKNSPLHTLVLLDIRAEENRFMTANEGIETLLKIEEKRGEKVITDETLVCVVARASSDLPCVRADYPRQLLREDFGAPLHCLVIPGELHLMETKALVAFAGAPKTILEKKRDK